MIEHSDVWYQDEGGLTKVICEECKYCLCALCACLVRVSLCTAARVEVAAGAHPTPSVTSYDCLFRYRAFR